MTCTCLSEEHQQLLLKLARQTITCGSVPELDLNSFPSELCDLGVTFVTLTSADGSLRGCIGALEADQPLVLDVCEHALAAARDDWRFPPVTIREVPDLRIEISLLTRPQPLRYSGADDLLEKLRPGIDGVILRDGGRRATFLPQVWEKLPQKEAFLSHLCIKLGLPSNAWCKTNLEVYTYQVEEFHEE